MNFCIFVFLNLENNMYNFNDLRTISHSLGIDLFKAVISSKLKDKKLPKEFYRNYYNASQKQAEIAGIDKLVEGGFMRG